MKPEEDEKVLGENEAGLGDYRTEGGGKGVIKKQTPRFDARLQGKSSSYLIPKLQLGNLF